MFSRKTLSVLLLALATATLSTAAPAPSGVFKILVQTPNLPTLLPLYLQPSGQATSNFNTAALCSINAQQQLLCSSQFPIVANPIGAPLGEVSVLLKAPKSDEPGRDFITTAWSIGKGQILAWKNNLFYNGAATFSYRMDASQGVFATLQRGFEIQVGTKAILQAVAPGNIPV